MSAPGPRRPSRTALEKRIAQASRQRDVAREAGGSDVAEVYDRLVVALRTIADSRE